MSAKRSYQYMMNRIETLSYLALRTRTISDRSTTALKSIQDRTTVLDPSIHCVLTRMAFHNLTLPHHYRVCQRVQVLLVI